MSISKLVAAALVVVTSLAPAASGAARAQAPRPDHIVVVIEENHALQQIVGSPAAPYINSLAHQGALFTSSFAVTHPSQPNYIALFSGSTQGVGGDRCTRLFNTPNLATQLQAAGLTFGGYSESMPAAGYRGCTGGHGLYARKHNPWSDFSNVPAQSNMPFSSFPADFQKLPAVSFVIPNLQNDMHDGSIARGDAWLRGHLDRYVQWARRHNSLLILTYDEDNDRHHNRITTVFSGAGVRPGIYRARITHYSILRTIEDMFGLGHLGQAAAAASVTGVWTH